MILPPSVGFQSTLLRGLWTDWWGGNGETVGYPSQICSHDKRNETLTQGWHSFRCLSVYGTEGYPEAKYVIDFIWLIVIVCVDVLLYCITYAILLSCAGAYLPQQLLKARRMHKTVNEEVDALVSSSPSGWLYFLCSSSEDGFLHLFICY